MVSMASTLDRVLSPEIAELFSTELGIDTVGQLLRYPPDKYLFNGDLNDDLLPEEGSRITTIVTVEKTQLVPMRGKKGSMLKLQVNDGKRKFEVTFFNAKWMLNTLTVDSKLLLAGTVKYFRNKLQLTHPNWLKLPEVEADDTVIKMVGSGPLASLANEPEKLGVTVADFRRSIVPIYRGTSLLETWHIWGAIKKVLNSKLQVEEILTNEQLEGLNLPGLEWSFKELHFPTQENNIVTAKKRFSFDEALSLQLVMDKRKMLYEAEQALPVSLEMSELETKFYQQLPFALTAGQEAVVAEIITDLAGAKPMNRLLQGEVGSGKTLVALATMLKVIAGGMQAVFLAPTEVLAEQHYQTLKDYLGELVNEGGLLAKEQGVRIVLLTGSMSVKQKEAAMLDIISGEADLIVGTHALLAEKVKFLKLGYVIVDEQQRFGVEQRNLLSAKGFENHKPHLLLMTATPIPRSIALTILGDTKISTLKQLPFGKRKIVSNLVPLAEKPRWLDRVWERINEEIAAGKQAYIVCFRIDSSEAMQEEQFFSAIELYEYLQAGPLQKVKLGLLHGKMLAADKTQVMQEFAKGSLQVLVATTVVEVGVDVPNASMMVIMNADRFGVSQLHQLRGRVGRKGSVGLCLFVTTMPRNSLPYKRLEAIAATHDGFELANIDLETRKEGDILGVLQSGSKTSLRFLSFLHDQKLIEQAAKLVNKSSLVADKESISIFINSVLGKAQVDFLEKS